MEEQVVLVDGEDNVLGTMGKMQAHREGVLHRAVSVFIMNGNGEMLLQKRALSKYHSPGLWTNTCCTHPRPDEGYADCAERRLKEEMGFSCTLVPAFAFIYEGDVENGLMEHELDHVFLGWYDGPVNPDPIEVEDRTFAPLDEISARLKDSPQEFTIWFRAIFERVSGHLSGMESHKKGGV
ncbi:MAG: isopentenyl-diphosphate Delta-isomerase [Flavobacteriales bacterium]|nr:isopentenyl-diphosphate Delta-isomerase [Flavobacteriales bacterium]